MSDEEEENSNKVIFLGESFVGKTNLLKISIGKPFDPHTLTTWTSSYVPKEYIYNNQKYIFHLWDTIGQEKYRSLTKIFFKDAIIVILVYDITKKKTFDALQEYWFEEVKNELGDDFILAIVGNKSDLYTEEEVSEVEGKNFAISKGCKFKLSSAKTDPLSFTQFLEELFKDYIEKNKKIDIQKPRGLSIIRKNVKKNNENNENKENKEKKCC